VTSSIGLSYVSESAASDCANAMAVSSISARAIFARAATSRQWRVTSVISPTIFAPRTFESEYHSAVFTTVARLGRLSDSSIFRTCSAYNVRGVRPSSFALNAPRRFISICPQRSGAESSNTRKFPWSGFGWNTPSPRTDPDRSQSSGDAEATWDRRQSVWRFDHG
jgi:hypothetical protein